MRLIQPQDLGLTANNFQVNGMTARYGKTPVVNQDIEINQVTYDPTILTKFIPASAFIPTNRSGELHDGFRYDNARCIRPAADVGPGASEGWAPVELPDNALLLDAVIWAYDNSAIQFNDVYFSITEDVQSFYWTEPAPGVYVPHFGDAAASLATGTTTGAQDGEGLPWRSIRMRSWV